MLKSNVNLINFVYDIFAFTCHQAVAVQMWEFMRPTPVFITIAGYIVSPHFTDSDMHMHTYFNPNRKNLCTMSSQILYTTVLAMFIKAFTSKKYYQ